MVRERLADDCFYRLHLILVAIFVLASSCCSCFDASKLNELKKEVLLLLLMMLMMLMSKSSQKTLLLSGYQWRSDENERRQ